MKAKRHDKAGACKAGHGQIVDVMTVPHPFAVERVHKRIPAGASVEGILRAVQPDDVLRRHAHVYIDGAYVPQENWARVYPKPGVVVTVRMVPMGGGGGKNPLSTVLSLAIMAVSPALAAGITGALGSVGAASFMGVSVSGLIGTGINLLGRLALNALAPPARPRFAGNAKESPTLFIQGARNRAVPFGRVPCVLGKHRMVPPLGAYPYTETAGGEQYLRMLFVWGYGPLRISDLKIGETPISEFEGVDIETRAGYMNDAPITLYSNSVLQNDMQVLLAQSDGYVIRTTDDDADEIGVDITFQRGLFKMENSGKKSSVRVDIEVQYAPVGSSTWSAGVQSYTTVAAKSVAGGEVPSTYWYKGRTHLAGRKDRVVLDPAGGSVKVLLGETWRPLLEGANPPPPTPAGMISLAVINRSTGDSGIVLQSSIQDTRASSLFGDVFKEASDFAVTVAPSSSTLQIASGHLKFKGLVISGRQTAALRKCVTFKVPKGKYNVRIRRLTADSTDENVFDEVTWTALRTIRYARPVNMKGVAMTALRIKATDQLNGVIDRFNGVVHSILPDWDGSAWTPRLTSNPAALFRHVLQGTGNARALPDARLNLDKLQQWHARCSMSEMEFNAVLDYDISVRDVLHDIASAGRASPTLIDGRWAVVEDMPQDVPVQHFTPRNTYGFKGEKAFGVLPHALRVRFVNREKGWLQDERLVFDDGYDAKNATVYETLELNGITDPAQAWKAGRYHIASARLRPEIYTFYADLEHIVCTRGDLVRLTHDVPLFGLQSARVRALVTDEGYTTGVVLDTDVTMESGKNYAARFRAADGASMVMPLVTVAGTGVDIGFSQPVVTESGPQTGDLAMFGEAGRESVELVVHAVEPQAGLNARIRCVDAARGIHMADRAAIPSYESQISVPVDMRRPPKPVIVGVESGEAGMPRQVDGSCMSAVRISLVPVEYPVPVDVDVMVRGVDETVWRRAVFTFSGTQVLVTDLDSGVHYDIRLVYKVGSGLASAPAMIANYLPQAAGSIPADVAAFNAVPAGRDVHLSWAPVDDIDLSHYRIKFSNDAVAPVWAAAFDIMPRVSRTATSVTLPLQGGAWLIKAVDLEGRESAAASVVSVTLDRPAEYALTEVLDDRFLQGMYTSGENVGVVMDGTGSVVLDDGHMEGTYYLDQYMYFLGGYRVRLTADIDVVGANLDSRIDDWGRVDDVNDWDGVAAPSAWSVGLQIRTASDYEDWDTPAWSPWRDFIVGEYAGEVFDFRLKLFSGVEGVSPSVAGIKINFEMEKWMQGDAFVKSLATDNYFGYGTRVDYPEGFYRSSALMITPVDAQAGDYFEVTSRDWLGFTVEFYNAAHARVTRHFDYVAHGVGRKTGMPQDYNVVRMMSRMIVPPSYQRQNMMDEAVRAIKDAGIWDKLDCLYVMAAHDSTAGMINWKVPDGALLWEEGMVSFAGDAGFVGNGSNAYLDTGYIPGGGIVYRKNDAHIGVWVVSNVSGAGGDVGIAGSNGTAVIVARNGSNQIVARINDATNAVISGNTDARGHYVVSRRGETVREVYKNGVSVLSDSVASTAVPVSPLMIGRNGSAYSGRTWAVMHCGSGLTDDDVENLHDILSVYLSAIGAI